jgi:hypothetical protein
MPVELDNAVALSKALKQYSPELAKETQKEIAGHLRKVVSRAKGFVPSDSPLSGWSNKVGVWEYRAFNAGTVKSGLGYSTTPSKPNKRGFRSLATIFNKSAAGAIYETAGRKNPQGLPPAQRVTGWTGGAFGKGTIGKVWESGREVNKSANPNAGKQFIGALPPLVDSQQSNSAGRRTRKTKGRLMFRAWAEDQGKTTAAVVKAIQNANMTVVKKSNARGEIDFRGRARD